MFAMAARKPRKNPDETTQSSSAEGVTEGKAEGEPEWLPAGILSARTRIPKRRIMWLGEAGEVRRQKVDGIWRYHSADLEQHVPEDAGKTEIVEALSEMRDAMTEANEQTRLGMRILTDSVSTVFGLLKDENDALRSRVKEASELHIELIKSREMLLSRQAEREALAVEAQSKAETRTEALKLAKTLAPRVIEGLVIRAVDKGISQKTDETSQAPNPAPPATAEAARQEPIRTGDLLTDIFLGLPQHTRDELMAELQPEQLALATEPVKLFLSLSDSQTEILKGVLTVKQWEDITTYLEQKVSET